MSKKKKVKDIYDVSEVVAGYEYYKHMLLEKALGMFLYDNCPKSLPQEQIERRLITDGYAVIFKHPKYGLVTSPAALYGKDIYYMPDQATYTQVVLGSGNLKIGKDCVVVYNSQVDQYNPQGLTPLIKRYARMLADIDSSIENMIINSRQQKMYYAKSPNAAAALEAAIEDMQNGKTASIKMNTFLEMIKGLDWNDSTNSGMNLDKYLSSKTKILADYLQEIGVKTAFEKNERLITSEVAAPDQLLTVNTADLEYCRKRDFEAVNKMFNENIIPRHNSAYFIKGSENDKEVEQNETNSK